jgi:tetratricopeptide (TPR) repeat protein
VSNILRLGRRPVVSKKDIRSIKRPWELATLAELAALNGDYRQALFLFKKYRDWILPHTRHWVEINMNIGMCYFHLSQYKDSEATLTKILDLVPDHETALEKMKLVQGFISSKQPVNKI